MKPAASAPLSDKVRSLITGIKAGERAALARAITLVESTRADHRQEARALIEAILPLTGRAKRIGITGVPGVGKSTFIEAFGTMLTAAGRRVAVLAIDPTSGRSGGSILGDKTRMTKLGGDERAFIRPSPTAGTLGGVARATREAMLLAEAAGFDVVIIETVGVGQSETVVAGMVDFFLVLMLPNAGDDLQGIKKGILELADLIAVNKADLGKAASTRALRDLKLALHITHPAGADWVPPVVGCSGLTGAGLEEIWLQISRHHEMLTASGALAEKRAGQGIAWMWSMIEEGLKAGLRAAPAIAARIDALEADVAAGRRSATAAAEEVLAAYIPGTN